MKIIISPFNSCYLNIASEEFLISNFNEDIFFLYINSPSIIVGHNQNTYAEINHEFVEENAIKVVRRRSGGGAVYHDEGNLNFGFIVKNTGKTTDEVFREFTAPIISALGTLGVKAEFSGRNDLTIDGAKFSGNAQWYSHDKVLIHGTMLFDSNLTVLSKALNASKLKFDSKAVASVRARVTNIRPHLPNDFGMEKFVSEIVKCVKNQFSQAIFYEYKQSDLDAIKKLAEVKYQTHEWNFGRKIAFSYKHAFRYEKGTIEINAEVKNGIIQEVKIFGDFFGPIADLSPIEKSLSGVPLKKQDLLIAISDIDLDKYMSGMAKETLVNAFFAPSDNSGEQDHPENNSN